MFLLLLFSWFIFNGKITVEITMLGMIICMVIYLFMCKFMDYSIKKDLMLCKKGGEFLYYLWVLLIEITKSSLQVMHLVLTDKEVIEPVIIRHKTPLKRTVSRVILANSITLTPGTFTVILEGDELIIHCLDEEMADGIESLRFERLLLKMEE